MRGGFYVRLARTGMRQNRQLYLPYLLTCVGMVAMFYIIAYLAESPLLLDMVGGRTMAQMMSFGRMVMAIFSLIFLFYTHSFLMRRRNREFGLYNILGMNKGNISRILLWETLLSGGIALVGGLGLGILFSKLGELIVIRMLEQDVTYTLSVSLLGVGQTAAVFALIFLLILFFSLGQVHLSNPLSLLRSENTGEKPPKANWLLALAGAVLLGAAYYLAVKIDDPLTAMVWFFVAVVMVIVATYLLFITGSVALCRLLQRNRGYYYHPRHFVSVSSMVYRMKRNGAGLASICILITMVLVTLSSTSCLYFGGEDGLRASYPTDFSVNVTFRSTSFCTEETIAPLRKQLLRAAGGAAIQPAEYVTAETSGLLTEDGVLLLDTSSADDSYDYGNLRIVYLLSLSDYNALSGSDVTLEPGQALLYSDGDPYPYAALTLEGQSPLQIQTVDAAPLKVPGAMDSVTHYYLFLPDFSDYVEPLLSLRNETLGISLVHLIWYLTFDMDYSHYTPDPELVVQSGSDENIDWTTSREVQYTLMSVLEDFCNRQSDICSGYSIFDYESERADYLALYGSLFFLGIALSLVFLFAAVLIIYYKQLSEGYEDQSRFEIMQKVGMTKQEIRRSINAQVLTVFFAPLLLAGVHLAFAFSLIWNLLRLLDVNNLTLLIWVNVICFLALGVLYGVVYYLTSRTYYRIVSGAKAD